MLRGGGGDVLDQVGREFSTDIAPVEGDPPTRASRDNRVNANRGSEQYHSTKSSMAKAYARVDSGDPSVFRTPRLAKSRSGNRSTFLGAVLSLGLCGIGRFSLGV